MAEDAETRLLTSSAYERAQRDETALTPAVTGDILSRRVVVAAENRWFLLWSIAIAIAALALRLPRLDAWALDASEAAHAYAAWVLFRGQPTPAGIETPDTGALLLLLEAFGLFLFGATDVVVRLVPVLCGLALVALPIALRHWLGWPAALAASALAALSPTLVYASRVVSPEVVTATLSLAALVLIVFAGEQSATSRHPTLAILIGIVAGAAFATGPSSLTVALALGVAVTAAAISAPDGSVRRGLRSLRREWPSLLLAALISAVLLFTRFLSHPAGLSGAISTLRDWWALCLESSGQPSSLFLMVMLIYELIADSFAIVAVWRGRRESPEPVVLLATWSLAAFTIWSFSAGHGPEHTVHVVLPAVLLAGIGLGGVLATIDWDDIKRGSGTVLALLMLGVVVGLAAFGVLLSGADGRGVEAALPAVAVLCLVVVPLAYLIWRLSLDARETAHPGQPPLLALAVLALLLGAFGLRSATLLAFYRADLGVEPLAQRTATLGTLTTVEGFLRLARDVGVGEGSVQDPTGSHGLSIALEQDVHLPYVWYFREFPGLTVVPAGAGATSGAQVVIAATDTGFADAGYTTQRWPWLNTVPQQYLTPDTGAALRSFVNPTRWIDLWRFLLFREGVPLPQPAVVSVGLTAELASRVMPATGPFDLSDRPGPGAEPGQFKDPIGVAISPDGTIAVVDSGNARVQRFASDGDFLGIWGEGEGDVTFTRTANGLGPTGITTGADGRTWVADTWGHRVVALDENGNVVQSIGGETIDIADDPARVNEAGGRFFGPRDVAVTADAIYVVDTGNERVQRFTPDGAFVGAWGGYGRDPGQLVEPVGIAVGPDDNIYVADSGNARVSIFTPTGEPVAQWPIAEWPSPDPTGLPPAFQPYLAFDPDGNLYATASNAGQAIVLDRNGSVIAHVMNAGNERLAQPVGIAIARSGKVYVSDIGRDAVVEYTPPARLNAPLGEAGDVGPRASP